MKFRGEKVLILEMEDLLDYDRWTHDIIVDKYVFDDFRERGTIYIHFVEDSKDCIREYEMTEEDEDGIHMDYMCEYED